jgi:pyruvate dehydrogenase E2 component (dihydrolipoyllysine-residue acetyltransferase)
MPVKVLMPKGSDTMTEGKVLKWLKNEGEPVSTGDAIVEIETDKVDMEVEALGSGVLRKIVVDAGKVAPVGTLLAVIAKPNEDITAEIKASGGSDGDSSVPRSTATAPAAAPAPVGPPPKPSLSPATGGTLPATGPRLRSPAPSGPVGGRTLASPLARRMANEMGLDLNRIKGSGPGGRIVRQDVERSAALAGDARRARPSVAAGRVAPTVPTPLPTPTPSPPRRPVVAPAAPEFYDEPLTAMRKIIAARLAQSLGPVPHFYLTVEVDMKKARDLRESANTLDPELNLTFNDIIVKACSAGLRQHPEVNASFQGESIRFYNRVHIGMAVATDGGGLITPVIRDADRKRLAEISHEAKDLITRARQRKLTPDEYVGGTFSISNLGMMGIEEFSAVINPPEGAILAVGAVSEKPVVVEGRIEVGLRCRITLSCDHRVVDGATGAKFLQTLKNILENPAYLAF